MSGRQELTRYMAKLQFEFEWTDPLNARGVELRATWGRLSIIVDDEPITRFVDHRLTAYRDSIDLPLYPLAEWIVINWWFLLAEVCTPGKQEEFNYLRRHALRSAAEGYALPALLIQPLGEVHQLSWSRLFLEHSQVEFIAEGTAVVQRSELKAELSSFVEAVIERLSGCGLQHTVLQEEWAAIKGLDTDEQEFAFAAGLLGVHPFEMPEDVAQELIVFSQTIDRNAFVDFLSAAHPETFGHEIARLKDSIGRLEHETQDLPEVVKRRRDFRPQITNRYRPWEVGYEAAQALRAHLDLSDRPLVGLQGLAYSLGVTIDDFKSSIISDTPVSMIDALSIRKENKSPAFASAHQFDESLTFAMSRCLYDYFFSTDKTILVTRSRSERQRCNRAFAAEFLLPATALRERIQNGSITTDEIDDLAREWQLSSYVVRHQIENHDIAPIEFI